MAASKAHHGVKAYDDKQENSTSRSDKSDMGKSNTGGEQYFASTPQSADIRRERKVT